MLYFREVEAEER